MPIYEYRCERGHTFEVMQRMTDDPVASCTTCDAPVQRVFHPVAVHFKGKGFYNTDYGTRARQRELAKSAEGKGGEGKSGEGKSSEAKGDGKSSSGTAGGSGDSSSGSGESSGSSSSGEKSSAPKSDSASKKSDSAKAS